MEVIHAIRGWADFLTNSVLLRKLLRSVQHFEKRLILEDIYVPSNSSLTLREKNHHYLRTHEDVPAPVTLEEHSVCVVIFKVRLSDNLNKK